MNYPDNPFTHALRENQKQLGLWISLCSPFAAEVTAPSGFDWAGDGQTPS